jgi:hypothetical protein
MKPSRIFRGLVKAHAAKLTGAPSSRLRSFLGEDAARSQVYYHVISEGRAMRRVRELLGVVRVVGRERVGGRGSFFWRAVGRFEWDALLGLVFLWCKVTKHFERRLGFSVENLWSYLVARVEDEPKAMKY